uniref:Variant surface glycoprotein 1125.2014 n=1 Tax=Trypanosoma brucei TaxID=5691 RepID=A0A1J0R4S4_9TRYP|nr:variant surface glycoprotein 1125.2014 [Trypanosoma brucei]
MRPLTLACIMLVLDSVQRSEAAAGMGLFNTAWEPICSLSEELGKITGHALSHSEKILNAALENELAAKRAAIYFAKNPTAPNAAAARTLAAYFSTRATRTISNLKDVAAASHIAAASPSAYLKGRIDDTMTFLERSTSSTNNGCLLPATTESSGAKRNADKLNGKDCGLKPPKIAAAELNTKHLKPDGYEGLKHEAGTGNQITPANGAHKCKLLTADNTNGYTASEAATEQFDLMGGYLQIKAADQPPALRNKADLHQTNKDKAPAWHEAHAAYTNLKTYDAPTHGNETGKLTDRPDLTTLVSYFLSESDRGSKDKIETAINEIFGDATAKGLDSALKEIDDESIPAGTACVKAETKLSKLKDSTCLAAILNHYEQELATRLKALQDQIAAEALKKKTQTEKECNEAKDNKTECGKKAGCTYNESKSAGEKCTLDEEAKQKAAEKATQETGGKDGKPTNTTASNSFVINTVPLLLAVLLF